MHPLAQANTEPLPLPQVDWRAIAPELALLVAGVVLLLVVAFWPRAGRNVLAGLTLAGLAVAAALTAWNWDLERVAFEGAISLDGITRYARVVLLAVGALATLMAAQDRGRGGPEEEAPPEVFPLLLFALTGMVLLAAASDLLVVFIALEILSLSLYVMAGATRTTAPPRCSRCCCSRCSGWSSWPRPPTCWWCSSPWRSCRSACTCWPARPAAWPPRRRP